MAHHKIAVNLKIKFDGGDAVLYTKGMNSARTTKTSRKPAARLFPLRGTPAALTCTHPLAQPSTMTPAMSCPDCGALWMKR